MESLENPPPEIKRRGLIGQTHVVKRRNKYFIISILKALTLYELNSLVSDCIEVTMSDDYWVQAELAELREVRGHCYMELVEKDDMGRTPIARASAKCWRNTWMLVKPNFERVTGQMLRAGMKVMLRVRANFHESFGFSWIVSDINPEYTLGDLARRRKEIIDTLKAEGVFELQHELAFPAFAQRIAVISSANAAGYGDFCMQLKYNEKRYVFDIQLFPAVMQGEQVERSIIAALNEIYARMEDFDTVVIIRGGGATSDMAGFDTLALAENVANFPLPVITGIGHDRDECVLDLVAHTHVKTPTAAAAMLIENLSTVERRIDDTMDRIAQSAVRELHLQELRVSRAVERLPLAATALLTRREQWLTHQRELLSSHARHGMDNANRYLIHKEEQIHHAARQMQERRRGQLDLLEQRTAALDPMRLLKRGYSLTMHDGKTVTSAKDLKDGDILETLFASGRVKSIVKKHLSTNQ